MKRKKSNTCLAVIKHHKKLYFAADRRSSWGFDQAQKMPRPKLSKKNGVILAATGDGFLCHLLVDVFEPPKYEFGIWDSQELLDTYMHYPFFKAIKKLLLDKGFCDEHHILKIPNDVSCELLVGLRGHCYTVIIENLDPENHFPNGTISIDEVGLPYATGCGGQWAWDTLDCLETLEQDGLLARMKPNDKLSRALDSAAKHSPGCGDGKDFKNE